ncbi:MAG TPA: hypothetical protein VH328_02890 [Burkholderiaceae bacterium]|nr:hypothetical protein [Burkholderiaceae bacterium]
MSTSRLSTPRAAGWRPACAFAFALAFIFCATTSARAAAADQAPADAPTPVSIATSASAPTSAAGSTTTASSRAAAATLDTLPQGKPSADPTPHPIVDPHYGDVLFEFFQAHYFDAITHLEVSQQFERMPHHADEAEVLRGGLLLSYGMPNQASAVFERLVGGGASGPALVAAPSVRDRAWYYLAKIRWQRGQARAAADALAHIEHLLPARLEEDRELLQANALMALGDNAGAARLLGPVAAQKDSTLYARYNLGVALVRAGEVARGTPILDAIGRMPAPNEEQRALRDKANVALGFAALRDGQPARARAALERVRLDGPQSNLALLGFGWAADALHDPRLALVPWVELAGRDATDAPVLEAQLAVPYAYAELGASGQALQRYTVAITNFDHESANLDATIAAIRQGRLVEGLMARNPGHDAGWFQSFKDIPLVPHAGHLTPVLAGNDFQEAFKSYRDLLGLQANLARWHASLGVFGDMVAARRARYAEALPEVRVQSRALDIEALQHRNDADAAELKTAEDGQDGAAFADARERELQARLARAQGAIDRLRAAPSDDAALADARERLRRIAGALQWELARAYSARDWDARKHQAQSEATLGQARTHAQELARAQADEPARFDAYAKRVAALDVRLTALAPRIDALTLAQAQALDELAIASLDEQKKRLAGYTAQARIAVAQLYDRATDAPPRKGGADAQHP